MAQFQTSNKGDLIWAVADLLRGDYKQSDYGKVILPMTVLRRLDCVLAPTKSKVLKLLRTVEDKSDLIKDKVLNKAAGHNFHNRSQFDFVKLVDDPNNVAANLRNYINGYSASAREIIEYFNFDRERGFRSESISNRGVTTRSIVWTTLKRTFCFR